MKPIHFTLLLGLFLAGCTGSDVKTEGRIAVLEKEVRQLKQALAEANKQIADGNELRKVIAAGAGQATENSSLAAQVLDTRVTQLEAALAELQSETDELGEIVDALIEAVDATDTSATPTTTAAPATPAPPP